MAFIVCSYLHLSVAVFFVFFLLTVFSIKNTFETDLFDP